MVRVHIHKARDNRLSFGINHLLRTSRTARSHAGDAASLHDDCAALNHLPLIQRHNARSGNRDRALRHRARGLHVERGGVNLLGVGVPSEHMVATAPLEHRRRTPTREDAAVTRELCDGECAATLLYILWRAAEPAPGERCHIHIVAFLKREPGTIWARHHFVGGREGDVQLAITTVGFHTREPSTAAATTGRRAALVWPEEPPFGTKART